MSVIENDRKPVKMRKAVNKAGLAHIQSDMDPSPPFADNTNVF